MSLWAGTSDLLARPKISIGVDIQELTTDLDFCGFFYRYLKVIDKFNERFISAYLTAGNIKLLLLHDAKSEDAIRNFFNDCYELYIKVSVVLPGQ